MDSLAVVTVVSGSGQHQMSSEPWHALATVHQTCPNKNTLTTCVHLHHLNVWTKLFDDCAVEMSAIRIPDPEADSKLLIVYSNDDVFCLAQLALHPEINKISQLQKGTYILLKKTLLSLLENGEKQVFSTNFDSGEPRPATLNDLIASELYHVTGGIHIFSYQQFQIVMTKGAPCTTDSCGQNVVCHKCQENVNCRQSTPVLGRFVHDKLEENRDQKKGPAK